MLEQEVTSAAEAMLEAAVMSVDVAMLVDVVIMALAIGAPADFGAAAAGGILAAVFMPAFTGLASVSV